MARVVVLGAGISGHTAALHLRKMLDRQHEVVVVSPNSQWNWIPSNIWVGVGRMKRRAGDVPPRPGLRQEGHRVPPGQGRGAPPRGRRRRPQAVRRHRAHLAPAQGRDRAARVRLRHQRHRPQAQLRRRRPASGRTDTRRRCAPTATPRRPPPSSTRSSPSCSAASSQTLVIGVGHGTCTCEGAAFEYTFNVEHELRARGLRDLATIVYLTNEYDLGDFGVGGLTFEQNGFVTSSQLWTESLFKERGVLSITRAHVQKIEEGRIFYETLDGDEATLDFDFAMLLPPFRGQDLQAFDRDGSRHHLRDVRPQRLPQGRRRLHAPSRTRSGRRRTGRARTSARATATSSASASPSRRRTRSRCPAPARAAPSSPLLPRAPGCRPGSWGARWPAASPT